MSEKVLDRVNYPEDIKQLTLPQLSQLAEELRDYLVNVISKTGGHLAPSLGVVELTLALHYVLNTPKDKIVWDVGHQAYIHKIITGRKEKLSTIRQYGGLSGFTKVDESEYDTFGVGHASTSISAALGMAYARDYQGENFKVVAVIGDGALTGGISFEGLNNAGASGKDIIIILNDNKMSISPNVGAISSYLISMKTNPLYNRIKNDVWKLTGKMASVGANIRKTVQQIEKAIKAAITPGLLFEQFGFRYFGPIEGHNLSQLIRTLQDVKELHGPILLHVVTVKGKGYKPAEDDAPKFHGLGAFDKFTGLTLSKSSVPSYTTVFGKTLVDIADQDEKIVGITAAMPDGTGMAFMKDVHPDRFIDVGIAEQHAVTFAAGLAITGQKPVVAIYSTFLQRAFDEIIHDVALQNLPVVFALDRGGLVGEDGPTHHGVFDLSYLRMIPNFIIMAPKDEAELQDMLWTAIRYEKGPVALRYPRGAGLGVPLRKKYRELEIGKSETLRKGSDVAVLAVGRMVDYSLKAAHLLDENGISARVENMRFVRPLDTQKLDEIARKFKLVFTVEDNVVTGGFGSGVLEYFSGTGKDVQVFRLGLPDAFVEHGAVSVLFEKLRLNPEGIAEQIRQTLESYRAELKVVKKVTSQAS
ncbi:MAG: 1-deoxy-D-xylulose-5-phosphate synthase [Calditrichaeota bacterium]|nr:1-deoxy-D-xylulose-5-phosphate synthase [Calditrichota bacterium]